MSIFNSIKLFGGKFINNKLIDKVPNISEIFLKIYHDVPPLLRWFLVVIAGIIFSLHYYSAETLLVLDILEEVYKVFSQFFEKHYIFLYFLLFVCSVIFICKKIDSKGLSWFQTLRHIAENDKRQDEKINEIEKKLLENREQYNSKFDTIIDLLVSKKKNKGDKDESRI